jgi:hypothetical protein
MTLLKTMEISYSGEKQPTITLVDLILLASIKEAFCLRSLPTREVVLTHAKTSFRLLMEKRTMITLISSPRREKTKTLSLLMLTLTLISLTSDITFRMVKPRENGSWSTHLTMIALRFTSVQTTRAGATSH